MAELLDARSSAFRHFFEVIESWMIRRDIDIAFL